MPLTQVEVVVLGVAYGNEEDNGVNNGYVESANRALQISIFMVIRTYA
jgi:hypothetical protein